MGRPPRKEQQFCGLRRSATFLEEPWGLALPSPGGHALHPAPNTRALGSPWGRFCVLCAGRDVDPACIVGPDPGERRAQGAGHGSRACWVRGPHRGLTRPS